ncbi:hypothetical protein Unana1_08901 [Umbelopsis nana]
MAPLQWEEIVPGRYERAMDDVESFYAFVASGGFPIGKEQWAITAGVKIELESADLVAIVKQAWTTLRYECPSLATTTEGEKRVYQVANDIELERWLKETFIVDDLTLDAKQLFSELRPVKQATLYLLLQSKEIVLRASHDRIDGIGTILFFDHLLRIMSSPQKIVFGDEAKNLSLPLSIAAHIPDATQTQADKIKDYMNKWVSSFPSIGLEIGNAGQLPGATQVRHVTLSENETANVIAAAKKRGLTPTHVAHAAAIFATRRHGKHREDTNYLSFGNFNLRARCDVNKHAVTTYSTGWPLIVVPSDFVNTANQLKEFYVGFLEDQDSLPMLAPFTAELKSVFSTPPPSPPSEPIISSLGIVDSRLQKTYGSIHVKDFWLAVDMLTPQVEIYVWTWQGKMTFEVCYNEVFHQDTSIEKFLHTLKDILFKELQ